MGTALRQLLPLIVMTAVLYMVLVIPQNKKRKEYNAMLGGLKLNDEVITKGGLMGQVVEIQEDYIIFQCGPDKTKLKLSKSGILDKLNPTDESGNPGYKEIKDGDDR